jgi:hypothetical protein
MAEIEKLEQVIHSNIALHERFCELLENEKKLFGEDKLDEISAQTKIKEDLEKEIKKNDAAISGIFKHMESGDNKPGKTQKKKISDLTNQYRARIDTTINLIGQTGKVLQDYKDSTMKDLKIFDKKQKAVNVYKEHK